MELRDAVDGAGSDNGEVGHADLTLGALLDQAHAAQAVFVVKIAGGHLAHEPPVDLVDDLQVARQEPLEHADGPLLQGLGQDGVVGIAGGMQW